MNTLLLKYAVEVDKTGSISKAADNLYMNQPHLSKAIKELEENIGIPIFNRTSKGVITTKKGKEFLSHAKKILSQIEELETRYKPNTEKHMKFEISVTRTAYITKAFCEFVKEIDSDKIKIDYRETNSPRAISNVVNGENNFAIIRYSTTHEKHYFSYLDGKDLKYKPILEFEGRLLLSKNHPLANVDEITQSMLDQYIEVTYGDLTIPTIPKIQQISRTDGKNKVIKIYERGSQLQLLSRLYTTYMWVAPIPSDTLEMYNLTCKKCSLPNNTFKDILVYRNGYTFSDYDNMFIDKINKEISLF